MSRLIKIAEWSGEKRGNIVFIHGLGGHPYETWQSALDASTFWPAWLAEDVKGLSVYSLGYISPPSNWIGTAMPLLDEAAHALRVLLNSEDLKTGPIAFVCHSLGGLMAKSIIRAAREQSGDRDIADFYDRIRQVVFIATPHTGAGKATLLEWLGWLAWPSASARNLVANHPGLRDLNFGYRSLAEARGGELNHLVYYEMLDTIFGGIVAPASADPGVPSCRPVAIREDHISIAKPKRRDDLVYAETRTLASNLAPEPRDVGELRRLPVEPFAMEWSWGHQIPKVLRVAAAFLVAAGLWLGIPWTRSIYASFKVSHERIEHTQQQTKAIVGQVGALDAKLEALLLRTAKEQGVPTATLRAILGDMGDAAQTDDVSEISQRLRVKAAEFKALRQRLDQFEDGDPEVKKLRKLASQALAQGQFDKADADLASAEGRELAAVDELRAIQRKRALSAAESRAERGAIAILRPNANSYRQAVAHYREAARIAQPYDPSVALTYSLRMVEALFQLGNEFGENAALNEAIEHSRAVLRSGQVADKPYERALWRNALGKVLQLLGERESSTALLDEAVTIFRAEVRGLKGSLKPFQWAEVHNNLGNALYALGERQSGEILLEEAKATYQAALLDVARNKTPLEWAHIQSNVAMTLLTLGQRKAGTAQLEEAETIYRSILTEVAREHAPLFWAALQNNLGNVLHTLGGRQSGTTRLEQSVAAFRLSLEERKRERVPVDWAATQSNLGSVLRTLGQRETGTVRLEQAADAFRAAAEEQTRERVPLKWALIQNNLGIALHIIGERKSSILFLRDAAQAYRASLQEWTRDRVPLQWAAATTNLGITLNSIGQQEKDVAQLHAALSAHRAALEERTRDRVPLEWAVTQNNLASVLQSLGELEDGTARLAEAVEVCRIALEELTRERAPMAWLQLRFNLGRALLALGRRENRADHLHEAVLTFRAVLDGLHGEGATFGREQAERRLSETLQLIDERSKTSAP